MPETTSVTSAERASRKPIFGLLTTGLRRIKAGFVFAVSILNRVEVPEGTMIPKGYGVAWYEPMNRWRAVCYPIPINWINGWARLTWIFLMRGPAAFIYKVETWLNKR